MTLASKAQRLDISAVCGRFQLINGVLSLRQNPGQRAKLNAEQDYCVAVERGRTGRGFTLRTRWCGGTDGRCCASIKMDRSSFVDINEAQGFQGYTAGPGSAGYR